MYSTVHADCPDGKYYCPSTGASITYGKCFQFPFCQACNSNYKDECNKGYDRWMSLDDKIQNSSLDKITIPGAHDAGMGEIEKCSDYAGEYVAKTQNKSFEQMLNIGVRYFDLRPIIAEDGNMYLGHFSWIGQDINIGYAFTLRNEGCFGYSVDEMFDDVKAFISDSSQNNREVVILKFSHFMNFKKYDNERSHFELEDFRQLEEKINDKLNGYLVLDNTNFLKTQISVLTEDGARVIVTFDVDVDGYDRPYEGIYSQTSLRLYDNYSDASSYSPMETDQFDKMDKYSFSKYFVLSWTITQNKNQAIGCMILGKVGDFFGHGCESIERLANKANEHLLKIQEHCKKTKKYPNVIYTDYVSEDQTKVAISINSYR